jgi:hypothetical protein
MYDLIKQLNEYVITQQPEELSQLTNQAIDDAIVHSYAILLKHSDDKPSADEIVRSAEFVEQLQAACDAYDVDCDVPTIKAKVKQNIIDGDPNNWFYNLDKKIEPKYPSDIQKEL